MGRSFLPRWLCPEVTWLQMCFERWPSSSGHRAGSSHQERLSGFPPREHPALHFTLRPILLPVTVCYRGRCNTRFGLLVRRGCLVLLCVQAREKDAVVVNEAFAAGFFAGADPIGKHLRIDSRWLTVIGVAPDIQQEIGRAHV